MKETEFLIVGQGIAGTLLSYFLIKKGRNVMVADENQAWSASGVAAGICNPLTGKRLVKTWKADEIFPFAEKTYIELELLLQKRFWFPSTVLQVPVSPVQQSLFSEKASSPEISAMITHTSAGSIKGLKHPAAFAIRNAAYVNLRLLLEKYRSFLSASNRWIEGYFGIDKADTGQMEWKGIRAENIIFCEGFKAEQNPLFSWIPFVPAKGELLTIYCTGIPQDKIIMSDIFLLPLGDNYFKAGSTYRWQFTNDSPTDEAREELIQKLDTLLDCSYSIKEHSAGIRPVVSDRKPVMGRHPENKRIGIFNGLGTKGVSLAPYFANEFADYLTGEKPFEPEVDISRFYKHWQKRNSHNPFLA